MSEPEPRLAGVLVAAGRGRRMGTDVDKLWHEAFGRAIWRWSLDALLAVPGMGIVARGRASGCDGPIRRGYPRGGI